MTIIIGTPPQNKKAMVNVVSTMAIYKKAMA
jgi:hypothetical protein